MGLTTTTTARAKTPAPAAPPGADRLEALDAYRGFVMLAMVSGGLGMSKLLGDPQWGWLAYQLQHVKWEGCTFWDLIQPSFMFIVGVAMPFAFARRAAAGDGWERQFLHAVKRALLLVAIGVFLDVYADGTFYVFREQVYYVQFIRVLQQIAIGYVIAFLVLHRGPLVQALTAAGLLAVHTAAYLIFAANTGRPAWEYPPEIAQQVVAPNVGVFLDEWLHLPLSRGHYVTFNAVSAAATILFGVLCGELFRSPWSKWQKLAVLLAAGVGALAVGPLLGAWVPLIKKLWTASFAIYAAGWTCLLMAAFYLVMDVAGWRRWAFPLVVVGMNSIAMYVMAGVFRGNVDRALKPFLFDLPARLGDWAPVLSATLAVLVLWGACYWLYRHRIFFKV